MSILSPPITPPTTLLAGVSVLFHKEKPSKSPRNATDLPGLQRRPRDSKSTLSTLLSILLIYRSEWVTRRENIVTKPSPELEVFF